MSDQDQRGAEAVETVSARGLDVVEGALASIERALAAFDDGSYGRCEVCGVDIAADRLTRRASERRCAAHDAG